MSDDETEECERPPQDRVDEGTRIERQRRRDNEAGRARDRRLGL